MVFTFCCALQYQSQRLRNGSGSSGNSPARRARLAAKIGVVVESVPQDSKEFAAENRECR